MAPCLHIPWFYYPARACIVLPCLLAQAWLAVRLQLLLHFDRSICCCNSRADVVSANIVSHDVIQSSQHSVLRMRSCCLSGHLIICSGSLQSPVALPALPSAPWFNLFVRLTQVGMCVVQELESDLTSSQQDSFDVTTDLRSEVSNLKTLLENKWGKSKEAQQQHEAAEAQSAAQLANLKTRLDTELAALNGQLESEQKRRVAAEEQHKAAQADLALASAVAEHLKSYQAVLLTEVGVVSASVMQVLSDRYVMHWCPPQAVNPKLFACMPVVSAPLALSMHLKNQVILLCPCHAL